MEKKMTNSIKYTKLESIIVSGFTERLGRKKEAHITINDIIDLTWPQVKDRYSDREKYRHILVTYIRHVQMKSAYLETMQIVRTNKRGIEKAIYRVTPLKNYSSLN